MVVQEHFVIKVPKEYPLECAGEAPIRAAAFLKKYGRALQISILTSDAENAMLALMLCDMQGPSCALRSRCGIP
jgi:hypothetical protein